MKTIALILFISPKTVEAHIRHIMQKLDCNSQDGIRAVVEKSDKLIFLRQYYSYLLIKDSFNKQLKNLFNLISKQNVSCFLNFSTNNKSELLVLESLKNHLKFVGIKVSKDIKNIKERQNAYEIYVIPEVLVSELNIDLKSKRDTDEIFQKYTGNGKNTVLLLVNKNINISKKIDYINFQNQEEYYNSFFKVLKKLLLGINIDEFVKDFNNQYQSIKNSLNSVYVETSPHSYNNVILKCFNYIWKSNSAIWGILVIIFTICLLSFWFFLPTLLDIKNANQKIRLVKSPIIWNLPRFIEYYTERKKLTNVIWDKFANNKKRRIAILAGLYGLGGVGKTTLAIEAVHNPRNKYEFIGWFSAETTDLLKSDYFELGEKFHLFSKGMSDKLKISIVKDWLNNKKSILLVYDNAPDMGTLNNYLPNNGHIIITSRNYKLSGAIEVDVMTKTEASNLLGKLISKKLQQTTDYQEQVKKLISILGYLPLAITQAGVYMDENMVTISNYLKLYKTHQKKLLNENSLPAGDQHKAVYVTWNLNVKTIKTFPNGDKALRLLDFISYCYPENIPKKLLMQYLYGNITNEIEIKFNKVLRLLRQYSLIKISPRFISIHRLVHNWIRAKHTESNKLKIIRRGSTTVNKIYPEGNKSVKEIEFVNILVPHIRAIVSQLKLQQVVDIRLVKLLTILGDSYKTLGDNHKSIYFFNDALITCEKHFSYDHANMFKILHDFGRAHRRLGNYTESKQLLEEAIVIIKNNYGDNDAKMAYPLHNLGRVYIRLGNYTKAKQLLEKALKIIKNITVLDNMEIAKILRNLGRVHICLGSYTKAEQLLEKALSVTKKYYNTNHIEVAYHLDNLGRAHRLYSS